MGASCSSEQGYDFCGPARPRSQPNAPGQQRPVEPSKAANDDVSTVTGTPQTEDDLDNGAPSRPAQTDIGSKWPYRTSTIKHPKVKIERKLWGRQEPDEGQDTVNAQIEREAAGLRGGAATRCFHMLRGIAPPGDDARRRAEGKMHIPQQYLQAMGEKRRDFYVKQAEDVKKVKDVRDVEEKAAAQKEDMSAFNDIDAETGFLKPADQEQMIIQNGNMVSTLALLGLEAFKVLLVSLERKLTWTCRQELALRILIRSPPSTTMRMYHLNFTSKLLESAWQ